MRKGAEKCLSRSYICGLTYLTASARPQADVSHRKLLHVPAAPAGQDAGSRDRQVERAAITSISGFAKLYTDAGKILTI